MVWTCDADGRREDTKENTTHKNGEEPVKRKTQNQMDRPNWKGYRYERGKLGINTRKQEVGE